MPKTGSGCLELIKQMLRGYKGTASLVLIRATLVVVPRGLIRETVVALIAPVVQWLEFCLAKAVTRVQIPAGAGFI